MARPPLRWLFLAGAALLPPSAGARAESPAPALGWRWTVRLDEELSLAEVELCCAGVCPRVLTLADPAAAAFLEPLPPGPGRSLALLPDGPGRWRVEGEAPTGQAPCAGWRVDLAALAEHGGSATRWVGADLLTSPAEWLAAPARFLPEHGARLAFVLPAGVEASAPWARAPDGSLAVPWDAFAQRTRVAFVRRPGFTLAHAGTELRVHVLDGPHRATRAGLERWLETAVETVASLWQGRMPVPGVQVLVEPVRPGGDPVPFGEATLAGGPAVHLLLSAAAQDEHLPGEWVAVHELTHLGQPWIVREDAWLSEGFVTYYQEVLRGRVGIFGEEATWQALHEGFLRGQRRSSPRSIAEDSAGMQASHAYHRVYWAGAALALRIDLALRAQTRGARTLDDAMRLWTGPEFRTRKGWRALELLAAADRAFGTTACVESVRAALASSAFPATDDLYARLGLVVSGEDVTLAPTLAAEARLRRSLVPLVPLRARTTGSQPAEGSR